MILPSFPLIVQLTLKEKKSKTFLVHNVSEIFVLAHKRQN